MVLPRKLLTPAIESLTGQILASVQRRDRYSIDDYYEMLNHPVVSSYAELRILLGLTYLQDYTHADENIQAESRAAFAGMDGSWMSAIAHSMNFIHYGWSFTERSFPVVGGRATLGQMRTLDPRRHSFQGTAGGIKRVEYRSTEGNIYLPYSEGMHLINQEYLLIDNSPYGWASCKRAMPYWEAHKLATACMLIACQRQATPMTVGKTDITASVDQVGSDGVILLDQYGQPIKINQGYAMMKRMEELENGSVIVIDREDELEAIAQQGSPAMFESCLKFFERMIALCWLVPETALGSNLSGTGDSGLNQGHIEILAMVTKSTMEGVAEQLIEKIVRPLLFFNYGELDDYGYFPVDNGSSEDAAAMLTAIAKVVDGEPLDRTDQGVIDRVKKLAGIA